jgi:prepilin-type N-terminal cleavage/methylation domain-containing protein
MLLMIFDRIRRKKSSRRIETNHLLSSLHFLAYQFPKSFWKKPTGIGMGRGVGTILLYFLGKRVFFLEKTGPNEDLASATTDTKSTPSVNNSGFTLIEMMISITLFSGILIGAFSAFGNITQLKNKVIADVDVYEQLYVAVESLSTLIKDG